MKNYKDLVKTKSDLKYYVSETGSHFFDRSSMKFFGDTMANYGLRKNVPVITSEGKVYCFELTRKRPVAHGLANSTFFNMETLERVFPK